jgi:hypothetical protein
VQPDHQAHRTSGSSVVDTEQRREGGIEFFPADLVGELDEWMATIHELLEFDAKQVALWIGMSGWFWVHDIARFRMLLPQTLQNRKPFLT